MTDVADFEVLESMYLTQLAIHLIDSGIDTFEFDSKKKNGINISASLNFFFSSNQN